MELLPRCRCLLDPYEGKLIQMRSFSEAALASFATPAEAVRTHWREYLMEAAELGALMFSICLFGSMLYSAASPLQRSLFLFP